MSAWFRRLRELDRPHPPEWYNRNPLGKNQWTGRPYRCARHPGAPRYRKTNGKPGSCCECVKAANRISGNPRPMRTAIGGEFKKWIASKPEVA
jgi:hypothetical protein